MSDKVFFKVEMDGEVFAVQDSYYRDNIIYKKSHTMKGPWSGVMPDAGHILQTPDPEPVAVEAPDSGNAD